MPDFLFLMHNDATSPERSWEPYLRKLRLGGHLQGGSATGLGISLRKSGEPGPLTTSLGGYVKVSAADLAEARTLLAGNPVYEADGTVEIWELPRTE